MSYFHQAAAVSIHVHHQKLFLPVLKQCVRLVEQAEKKGIGLEYVGLRIEEDDQGQHLIYLKLDGADRTVTGSLRGKDLFQVLRVLFDRLIRAYQGNEQLSHVSFL
ncbi:MAG: hypothetical protein K6T34_05790 [Thermoflavifilum sp.]|nr:hypothetical protein [Thermoflavifilum sp.]